MIRSNIQLSEPVMAGHSFKELFIIPERSLAKGRFGPTFKLVMAALLSMSHFCHLRHHHHWRCYFKIQLSSRLWLPLKKPFSCPSQFGLPCFQACHFVSNGANTGRFDIADILIVLEFLVLRRVVYYRYILHDAFYTVCNLKQQVQYVSYVSNRTAPVTLMPSIRMA